VERREGQEKVYKEPRVIGVAFSGTGRIDAVLHPPFRLRESYEECEKGQGAFRRSGAAVIAPAARAFR